MFTKKQNEEEEDFEIDGFADLETESQYVTRHTAMQVPRSTEKATISSHASAVPS
jgi:hypothetical protein